MADNPALTEIVTHDLNRTPQLPFDDASFDGAVLTVSVQYLIHPLEVFAAVGRMLKSGAPFIVTFSNRMFPTKAVAIWAQCERAAAGRPGGLLLYPERGLREDRDDRPQLGCHRSAVGRARLSQGNDKELN